MKAFLTILVLFVGSSVIGCGDSKVQNGQPQLADPNAKQPPGMGPAKPAGAGQPVVPVGKANTPQPNAQ